MKDYIIKRDENAERRFLSPQIEIREEGDLKIIEGIAAVVETEADMGYYREKISRGAFDSVLNDDVVALFNHDPNFPLARTTATGDAKLDLFITNEGHLGYRYSTPNTSVGRDLAENIRNGVISKSSFAFIAESEEWETNSDRNVPDIRTITKMKRLYDVSPVTYPAYKDTTVATRNLEKIGNIEEKKKEELEADSIARDKAMRKLRI